MARGQHGESAAAAGLDDATYHATDAARALRSRPLRLRARREQHEQQGRQGAARLCHRRQPPTAFSTPAAVSQFIPAVLISNGELVIIVEDEKQSDGNSES